MKMVLNEMIAVLVVAMVVTVVNKQLFVINQIE